jgi:hypothetical protein
MNPTRSLTKEIFVSNLLLQVPPPFFFGITTLTLLSPILTLKHMSLLPIKPHSDLPFKPLESLQHNMCVCPCLKTLS